MNHSAHIQIVFGGRVWDETETLSEWSAIAHWSMGLLSDADKHANWIGAKHLKEQASDHLQKATWIWYPEGKADVAAPTGKRYFRRIADLPTDEIKQAKLLFTADDAVDFYINGEKVGRSDNWRLAAEVNVAKFLKPGRNILSVSAENSPPHRNPAGFVAAIRIDYSNHEQIAVKTDWQWRVSRSALAGWNLRIYDDHSWAYAQELGHPGIKPWGELSTPQDRKVPAVFLRKEFEQHSKIRKGTAYVCGLGLFEFYANGKKIGNQVLAPALSDYNKRAFYLTFDVTSELKEGLNAFGVILGNGRFYAPRAHVPTDTVNYGFPRLWLQVRIENQDGTITELTSDETWKVNVNGPILSNNDYDGEVYDARLDLERWSEAGYDDSQWTFADKIERPHPKLVAQMIEPIRITSTLNPVKTAELKPGVYLYDFGQNISGWCCLRLSGHSGTKIILNMQKI